MAWTWGNFIQNVGAPVAIAMVIVWFGYGKLENTDRHIAEIETTLLARNEIFRTIEDNQKAILQAQARDTVDHALISKDVQNARILAEADWTQLQRQLDECVQAAVALNQLQKGGKK